MSRWDDPPDDPLECIRRAKGAIMNAPNRPLVALVPRWKAEEMKATARNPELTPDGVRSVLRAGALYPPMLDALRDNPALPLLGLEDPGLGREVAEALAKPRPPKPEFYDLDDYLMGGTAPVRLEAPGLASYDEVQALAQGFVEDQRKLEGEACQFAARFHGVDPATLPSEARDALEQVRQMARDAVHREWAESSFRDLRPLVLAGDIDDRAAAFRLSFAHASLAPAVHPSIVIVDEPPRPRRDGRLRTRFLTRLDSPGSQRAGRTALGSGLIPHSLA